MNVRFHKKFRINLPRLVKTDKILFKIKVTIKGLGKTKDCSHSRYLKRLYSLLQPKYGTGT